LEGVRDAKGSPREKRSPIRECISKTGKKVRLLSLLLLLSLILPLLLLLLLLLLSSPWRLGSARLAASGVARRQLNPASILWSSRSWLVLYITQLSVLVSFISPKVVNWSLMVRQNVYGRILPPTSVQSSGQNKRPQRRKQWPQRPQTRPQRSLGYFHRCH
jgi:uncharacterized paraquat-inducible protein A